MTDKGMGCLLYNTEKYFADGRGYFTEVHHTGRTLAAKAGFPKIIQFNVSRSGINTVRGMHFNTRHPQAKLLRVLNGSIIDVVVDLRIGSPEYMQVQNYRLSADAELLVPAGFAHGFWSLEPETIVMYGCSERYKPKYDKGLSVVDRQFEFPWRGVFNLNDFNVTDKDVGWPVFDPEKPVFRYDPGKRFGCTIIK